MALKQTIEAYELLDSAAVTGEAVAALLRERGLQVEVTRVRGQKGSTDFVRTLVPGMAGKDAGGPARTLGIIGRLGGIGARPAAIGLVSDADGAITAIACALKLGDMARAGDRLPGDVIIATHVCPNAPVIPHEPVPFMGAPVDMATMNRQEVHSEMDAILSVDTTRGNWVVNRRGFAISPTVKEGYILKVSPDLLRLMSVVTGQLPVVLPLATQDITPYGNGLDHINSVMQPATATNVPVVGVALIAETAVPGPASGASQVMDIEMAVRFCLEVAKAFGRGGCSFYDTAEFARLVAQYGSMKHLQGPGLGLNRNRSDAMKIIIRPATMRDYDNLCDLIGEVDALHRDQLPHLFRKPHGPARETAYILDLISDQDTGLFVAEVQGQLAGFVNVLVRDAPPIAIFVPRRLAIVDNLAVRRDFRQAGIGRALMEKAQRWAIAKGASTIELNVYEFNKPAIAFYETLGYEPLSRRMSRRLGPGGDQETDDR